MSDPNSIERQSIIERVDIRDVPEWEEPPRITFDQQASFQIAKWVLVIFAAVYLFCFVLTLCLFLLEDATFEESVGLIKYMLGSILPLVTLAVGYYLGDKTSGQ